jgi:hypothetical protein
LPDVLRDESPRGIARRTSVSHGCPAPTAALSNRGELMSDENLPWNVGGRWKPHDGGTSRAAGVSMGVSETKSPAGAKGPCPHDRVRALATESESANRRFLRVRTAPTWRLSTILLLIGMRRSSRLGGDAAGGFGEACGSYIHLRSLCPSLIVAAAFLSGCPTQRSDWYVPVPWVARPERTFHLAYCRGAPEGENKSLSTVVGAVMAAPPFSADPIALYDSRYENEAYWPYDVPYMAYERDYKPSQILGSPYCERAIYQVVPKDFISRHEYFLRLSVAVTKNCGAPAEQYHQVAPIEESRFMDTLTIAAKRISQNSCVGAGGRFLDDRCICPPDSNSDPTKAAS